MLIKLSINLILEFVFLSLQFTEGVIVPQQRRGRDMQQKHEACYKHSDSTDTWGHSCMAYFWRSTAHGSVAGTAAICHRMWWRRICIMQICAAIRMQVFLFSNIHLNQPCCNQLCLRHVWFKYLSRFKISLKLNNYSTHILPILPSDHWH